jgi:hypothetical protein
MKKGKNGKGVERETKGVGRCMPYTVNKEKKTFLIN